MHCDYIRDLILTEILQKIVIKVDFVRAKCKAVAMTVVAKIPGTNLLDESGATAA